MFESCVISLPDEYEGEKLYLFIASKEKGLETKINESIISNFGSFAVPSRIFYVDELPKTRSGKILRRLLRSILIKPDSIKKLDLNVMADKKIILDIIDQIQNYGKN